DARPAPAEAAAAVAAVAELLLLLLLLLDLLLLVVLALLVILLALLVVLLLLLVVLLPAAATPAGRGRLFRRDFVSLGELFALEVVLVLPLAGDEAHLGPVGGDAHVPHRQRGRLHRLVRLLREQGGHALVVEERLLSGLAGVH